MSVASYVADDLFRFTVVKHHTLNPSDSWANTYEFQSDISGSTDELLALGVKLVEFESQIHFGSTVFDRLIISTWQADSVPYEPDNFISSSLTLDGQVTSGTDALGLSTVMSVARLTPSGRFGHIFYRNVLNEGDVTAPAGKNVLVNRPGKQSALNTAQADSEILDYIGLAATGGLHLCLIDRVGTIVRPVLGLAVQGVTQVKTDHKWYNRTSGP